MLHSFKVDLFTVCRVLSQEAQDVFYDLNKVRMSNLFDVQRNHPLIRNLEVAADYVLHGVTLRNSFNIAYPTRRQFLHSIVSLEHLRMITVTVQSTNALHSIRQLLNKYTEGPDPASTTRCIDYGVYKVVVLPTLEDKFFIKCTELIKALPEAMSLSSLTFGQIQELSREAPQGSTGQGFQVIRVAVLALAYRTYRASKAGVEVGFRQRKLLCLPALSDPALATLCRQVPAETQIYDFSVQEHGEDVVRLASEWLLEHTRF